MPDLSSNRTALRADGHRVRAYLAVFGGVVIASGTLDAAPASGATALAWTRTGGASASIKPGYRVVVEDGSGNLKFETSVRYSGTISDSNLPIREVATAEFTLSAADTVKVYNTPVLTDKLVEANSTFAPDGITYSNQNTVIAPIVNSGGHWCGFVDSGQTYATVVTSGGGSFTVDPDSGGTITHLWTLPAGVAFAGGSANTDASPTLQADVGYHVVTHTVTDSANSATWTQYVLLRVYDATTRPVECVIESLDSDGEMGWSGRVRLFDNATLSAIPDRSLVAVFVDETINGAAASYGNRIASRSHVKLLGYLARDENDGDADDDRLTVEIISPWARLREIPGFSKVLERYSATAGWNYLQGLTVKRAIIQILRWYTNWTEYFDLAFDTFTDYDYPAFYVEKNTPLAQLLELADGTDARVTGDRAGALLVGTRQELVALASRSSLTTTLTLTDDDRITYRFSRDHFRTVETLECRGFTAATTAAAAVPIYSRYPGVPGRGAAVTASDRLIASTQANLNDRCGLRGAALDGVFITSAGLAHRAVELELELPGSYDVFDPAYQEWIAFSGAAGNRRALDLSALRFILRGVSIAHSDGTARTTLRLVSETAAPAGQTYVPPSAPGATPNFSLDLPALEVPSGGFGGLNLVAGTGRIALICQNGLARTTNFGQGAATVWDYQAWTAFSPAAGIGAGRGAYTAVPDAFSYASGSSVKCWVLYANNGAAAVIYYLDIAARTWTLKHSFGSLSFGLVAANNNGGGIDASYGTQNFLIAQATNGTAVAYTTDGSTFTNVTVGVTYVYPDHSPCGVYASSRAAGYGVLTSRKSGSTTFAHETTDYGATWLDTSDPNMDIAAQGASSIHSPPDTAHNPGENIFFYGVNRINTTPAQAVIYRANGASRTSITPSVGGVLYRPFGPRNGLSTFAGNANRLLLAGFGNDSLNGNVNSTRRLFLTDNALAATPTWTELTSDIAVAAMSGYGACAIAGDSGSTFYLWSGLRGTEAAVALSTDSGATIRSQAGNLSSFSPGEVRMLVGW